MLFTFTLETQKRDQMLDITEQVQEFITRSEVKNGVVIVYSPHTTAGITLNENADPDVRLDFLRRLAEIFPWDQSRDRHSEGNSAAHLKASTVGVSQTVLVQEERLLLGRWQGIYFCEFDGPRHRRCLVKVMREQE